MNLLKKASILIAFLPFFSFAQNNYDTSTLVQDLRDIPSGSTINSIGNEDDPGVDFIKNGYFNKFKAAPSVHLKDTGEYIEQRYFRVFAGAGVNLNTMKFSGTVPLYNSTGSHNSTGVKLAAGINFYPVPVVGQSVIRLEVNYTSASFVTSGNLYLGDPTVKTYSLDMHAISIIPQFQYNVYNANLFKVYLDLGLSVNISQYSNNSLYDSLTHLAYSNYFGVNKSWVSVPIKAGVILNNNFEFSIAYSYSQVISDHDSGDTSGSNFALKSSSVQASINYLF